MFSLEPQTVETTPETHVHNYQAIVRVEPMCAKEGSTTFRCVDCSDSYVEVIPATGIHVYELVQESSADQGEILKCFNCGYTIGQ